MSAPQGINSRKASVKIRKDPQLQILPMIRDFFFGGGEARGYCPINTENFVKKNIYFDKILKRENNQLEMSLKLSRNNILISDYFEILRQT